jgi:hypothetical protein
MMGGYVAPDRNYDGIQDEELRRKVDPAYTDAHDTLSAAYYDCWRHGKACRWREWDVIEGDPKATKALFDKLHGLVEHERLVALGDEDTKAERQTLSADTLALVSESRAKLADAKWVDGIELAIVAAEEKP